MPSFVPGPTLRHWQALVDLIARLAEVPAALIMQTNGPAHGVLVASNGDANPYTPGQTFELSERLYCETVIRSGRELLVPDSALDPRWIDNDDTEYGMRFYLGLPIHWPDGSTFGTICILDSHRNEKALAFRQGMAEFCRAVEVDLALMTEIDRRERAEAALQATVAAMEETIDHRTRDLREANIALRVILESVQAAKLEVEDQITRQIAGLVLPHLAKLKLLDAGQELQRTYLEIIETNLENIASPRAGALADRMAELTPTEIEVAQMVARGLTTKEIAQILSRGASTVEFHRNNIRRKLGLQASGTHLRQHLSMLSK